MKIRKFNIENYNKGDAVKRLYLNSIKKSKFKGIDIESGFSMYQCSLEKDYWDKLEGATKRKVIAGFKKEYDEKSNSAVKKFDDFKKYADKILFDDKDYMELVDTLQDNYYCQAYDLLKQLLEGKTKGKSAKALKYQARKMSADDISCD